MRSTLERPVGRRHRVVPRPQAFARQTAGEGGVDASSLGWLLARAGGHGTASGHRRRTLMSSWPPGRVIRRVATTGSLERYEGCSIGWWFTKC